MPLGSLSPVFEAMTGFGTLGLALVTLQGLQSWRSQRIWDHSLEVGRELIRLLQKYENEAEKAFSSAGVFAALRAVKASDEFLIDWSREERLLQAYRLLTDKLMNVHDEVDRQLQEAATIWGDKVLDWPDSLKSMISEYYLYTYETVGLKQSGLVQRDLRKDRSKSSRKVVDIYIEDSELSLLFIEPSNTEFTREFFYEINGLKKKVREKMQLPK
ncbi:hypothetical protein [Tritonibacter mobilis]|uniref:hypothetical protein n=1 Tax=Tritonibacter mobilis TaxID=379347 RepID=UPI000806BA2F|nr:hypothetical protein [Tritonibacter mobilis]